MNATPLRDVFRPTPRQCRTKAPESPEFIPDECGRREMSWKEFIQHIRRCQNRHCREVLRNHMELVDSFRIGV